MKNFLFTLAMIMTITLSSTLSAQTFEGTIKMKMEVLNLPPEMESMKSMMESTITTSIKGLKSRTETSNALVSGMVILTDGKSQEIIMCSDIGGEKTAVVSSMKDYEQQAKAQGMSEPVYTETAEQKVIAGYTCKKMNCTMESAETGKLVMEFWYTKDIPNTNLEYNKLPGMPLEYSMDIQGMTMHFVTEEVKKEKISDSSFEIPAGYTKMTQEEFQKKVGGQ